MIWWDRTTDIKPKRPDAWKGAFAFACNTLLLLFCNIGSNQNVGFLGIRYTAKKVVHRLIIKFQERGGGGGSVTYFNHNLNINVLKI